MKTGVVGKVPKAICTDNDSESSQGSLTFEPYDPSFKNPENLDNKGGVAEALFQLLRADRVRLKIIRAFDGESKFTVTDMKVNGRQNCHGHGLVNEDDGSCICEHGTEGATCNSCKALYKGAPKWYVNRLRRVNTETQGHWPGLWVHVCWSQLPRSRARERARARGRGGREFFFLFMLIYSAPPSDCIGIY